ncbi:heavy metal translocating P-type ATPase [Sphingosinicella sp.]|jgi:Cd2+/Zn2+-exporting ATPase|uniref:heavy metal translocating P-type ATPase n=1 Tax=Sphingosinicella sp. TaxID=1917971 RepID=UPI0018048798|nr:heavy metal translocating P-type ATPase [Sphingosinicella sp.]MBA4758004.1 heavy metal translocating P-type ATPase [Sphingosinicella sp.]
MTETVRLDIELLLPEVPDEADRCLERLSGELQGRPGVEKAHVVAAQGDAPVQLCIHYDPDVVPLERVRQLARSAGAALTDQYQHLLWTDVEGLGHTRRARTVSDRLRQLPGVVEAEASAAGMIRVEFSRTDISLDRIRAALADMGVYPKSATAIAATPVKDAHDEIGDHSGHDHAEHAEGEHVHAHGGIFGANPELYVALLCGAVLGVGFAIEKVADAPTWVSLAFYIAAYGLGGWFTLREAIENLKLKRFEIDTLMLVAAAGAAALGAWAEGALLLFLFSFGHALEHYAMGRAKRAIEALAELAPQTALVRRDSEVREFPVEELVVGDIVIVKPNERLPADGFIVLGRSSVNQAPVTGESVPVDKEPVADAKEAALRADTLDAKHRVFAGTINGEGAIEIAVTRLSTDTTLAKVVKMVNEAETQKSPTQRFTDKFERIFVPSVLGLVFLLLFAGFVVDEPFRDSFYRAMAVLVAASPCALAIATPSAVLSGVARAARGGVLVKGGGPLENLGSLTSLAFDKTGTLTEGRPRITDTIPAPGVTKEELLAIAVAVESLSDHPLAAAIARDGREIFPGAALPVATDLKSLTGRGVEAKVDGEIVSIGKAEMFGTDGIAPLSAEMATAIAELREKGRTTMVVRRGTRDLGAIGLMDTPRAAARETIARLSKLGIRRMIMISGDHQKVAESIAAEVGLSEAWGDLMPEQKVDAIKKLRAEMPVAMVGDGVNDAPAMASATVGIAMGAAGSDVALETADIALMADDLSHLPFAIGLSRCTRSIIRQNMVVSLGVVVVLVPATIFGLGIGPAVAAHEGSTLIVVANALRLLAYRE